MGDAGRAIRAVLLVLLLPFYGSFFIFLWLGLDISGALWLLGAGVVFAALGVTVPRLIRWRNKTNETKKRERQRAIEDLRAKQPDVASPIEFLLGELERSSTQSAYLSFVQNLAFFVLGVAVPILLGKLGLI